MHNMELLLKSKDKAWLFIGNSIKDDKWLFQLDGQRFNTAEANEYLRGCGFSWLEH